MSTFRNGSDVYSTKIGSDIDRDGFFVELYRETESGPVFVAEAFWSDENSSFVISFTEKTIPFSVLELFIVEARSRVPPKNNPQENNWFIKGTANGA